MHDVTPHRTPHDGGYSLIEIMVTIVIMGTLLALAAGGFRGWALAHAQEGTATSLQTILRQTQTRSITEGVSFCVKFDTDADTYTVNRYACDTPLEHVGGPFRVGDERVHLTQVRFMRPDGTTGSDLTFKPTGTASAGTLQVTREGSDKTYSVAVEGFTGRVAVS